VAYRLILKEAANNGLHALGMSIPNSGTVYSMCLGSESDCIDDVRLEVLTGEDVSDEVDVDRANCIENRLAKALAFLQANHPEDDWGQFVSSDGEIQWSLLRLAGHSQGGGTAGHIAKLHEVDRVTFFSAPSERRSDFTAAWISASGPTDSGRFFGFAHSRDTVIPWVTIEQNWTTVRMDGDGDSVNVDSRDAARGDRAARRGDATRCVASTRATRDLLTTRRRGTPGTRRSPPGPSGRPPSSPSVRAQAALVSRPSGASARARADMRGWLTIEASTFS
jgi:hypothetical protein